MLLKGRRLHRTCKSKAEAQKIACEATAAATFKANFDADPNQEDYFDDVKGRLVQWINLNQQLGEIDPETNVEFRFSDGLMKFDSVCRQMKSFYSVGAKGFSPTDVCNRKVNSNTLTTEDKRFQELLLEGVLSNGDAIPATDLGIDGPSPRFSPLRPSESGHFDHFHIKVSP